MGLMLDSSLLIAGERRGQRVWDILERELSQAIPVHPVTLEIAQLAGRIEGEQAAKGVVIALPDLLIGVTALH